MLQATIGDCLALDLFAFGADGVGPAEVHVGRCKIASNNDPTPINVHPIEFVEQNRIAWDRVSPPSVTPLK